MKCFGRWMYAFLCGLLCSHSIGLSSVRHYGLFLFCFILVKKKKDTHTTVTCENSIQSHLDWMEHSGCVAQPECAGTIQGDSEIFHSVLVCEKLHPTQSQLVKMLIGERSVPEETQLWIREASCHLVSMHASTSV